MNIKNICVFLTVVVLTASCAGNESINPQQQKNSISFKCESSFVKTSLNGKSTLWTSGDKISVFDGFDNCMFSTQDAGREATFIGEAGTADKYYALYPYNPTATINGARIRTTLPSVQIACKDGFATNTGIMVASTTGKSLVFDPQMVFFKITIPANVSSITLQTYNRVCLAGNCEIDVDNSTVTLTGNASERVVLVAEDGGALQAGTYYLEVLPTVLTAGCQITLSGTGSCAGKQIVKSTPKYYELRGGTIYDMGSLPANWEPVPGIDVAASFTKGVNLSGCFEVGAGCNANNIWMGHINDIHFSFLNSRGVDVVRVPMQMGYFIDNAGYQYHLQDVFFQRLDELLNLAEKYDMSVIVDNHVWGYYDKQTNPQECMTAVWRQVANHCKDRSVKVVYELFNEPDGQYWIDNWHNVQGNLISTIRQVDTKHTIVVTPAPYKSIADLPKTGGYSDKNLLYTYHCYFPYEFTHQGVPYQGSVVTNIGGKLHFPYQSGDEKAAELVTDHYSQVYYDVKNYASRGTVGALHENIHTELAAAAARGGKLFVGEFGTAWAYGMDDASRCNWLRNVVSYLDANKAMWTLWCYANDFGIFKHLSPNINPTADLNVNVAEALGFIGRTPVSQQGLVDQFTENTFQW